MSPPARRGPGVVLALASAATLVSAAGACARSPSALATNPAVDDAGEADGAASTVAPSMADANAALAKADDCEPPATSGWPPVSFLGAPRVFEVRVVDAAPRGAASKSLGGSRCVDLDLDFVQDFHGRGAEQPGQRLHLSGLGDATNSVPHVRRLAMGMFHMLTMPELTTIHDNIVDPYLMVVLGLQAGTPKLTATKMFGSDAASRRAATAAIDGYRGRANAAPLRAWLAAP